MRTVPWPSTLPKSASSPGVMFAFSQLCAALIPPGWTLAAGAPLVGPASGPENSAYHHPVSSPGMRKGSRFMSVIRRAPQYLAHRPDRPADLQPCRAGVAYRRWTISLSRASLDLQDAPGRTGLPWYG